VQGSPKLDFGPSKPISYYFCIWFRLTFVARPSKINQSCNLNGYFSFISTTLDSVNVKISGNLKQKLNLRIRKIRKSILNKTGRNRQYNLTCLTLAIKKYLWMIKFNILVSCLCSESFSFQPLYFFSLFSQKPLCYYSYPINWRNIL
jgi:hypothetical protein